MFRQSLLIRVTLVVLYGKNLRSFTGSKGKGSSFDDLGNKASVRSYFISDSSLIPPLQSKTIYNCSFRAIFKSTRSMEAFALFVSFILYIYTRSLIEHLLTQILV